MKKKLNIEGVTNELKGGSAFFPSYKKENSPTPSPQSNPREIKEHKTSNTNTQSAHPEKSADSTAETANIPDAINNNINHDTTTPRYHDTTTPRNHDTMIPSVDNTIFEIVRRAVKHIGKEAATHRFTIEEKNQLADIEYTYKRHGVKTSENEITRIAINYFIEDYRNNGEESLLAKILKRVNS
jgi:hypothetical protein